MLATRSAIYLARKILLDIVNNVTVTNVHVYNKIVVNNTIIHATIKPNVRPPISVSALCRYKKGVPVMLRTLITTILGMPANHARARIIPNTFVRPKKDHAQSEANVPTEVATRGNVEPLLEAVGSEMCSGEPLERAASPDPEFATRHQPRLAETRSEASLQDLDRSMNFHVAVRALVSGLARDPGAIPKDLLNIPKCLGDDARST